MVMQKWWLIAKAWGYISSIETNQYTDGLVQDNGAMLANAPASYVARVPVAILWP